MSSTDYIKAKKLGDLLNFKRGYDLPEKKRLPGPYPVISSSGVTGYHNDFKVEGEGVVTGRYGTLGEMYYVNERYWPHNTALYVTDFKGNVPKYIYYLLSCLGRIRTSDKSAVPGVNRNELHEMVVPAILDSTAQSKIVEVLTVLDEKILLNTKIHSELESMLKMVFDYWFLQFEFPDSNGRTFKTSGGTTKYNEALKREIPEGWIDGSLEDIGRIVGGSTPSTEEKNNFTKNGTSWITPNDLSVNIGKKYIARGAVDVTEDGIKSASLKKYPRGTVLLSSRAPIGYMAIARNDLTTNQGFKSIVPEKGYSTEFTYYTVQNSLKAIMQFSSGSTFKEISGAVLKTVKICIPPTDLAELFTRKVKPFFEQQELLENENAELVQLRDWLLPMLMSGQVSVEDF